MGVSTISRIVLETCDVIWQILQPIEMAAPTTQDWLEISNAYFKTSQFPNCVGTVDGKHIWWNIQKIVGHYIITINNIIHLFLWQSVIQTIVSE